MASTGRVDVAGTVGRALALHRSGRLVEAEVLYRSVLNAEPENFEALHFLGLIEAHRQNFHAADRLMGRSLEINGSTAEAFANHARVLNALKRSQEACAACDRALAIDPRAVGALISRGIALAELGRNDEALASYDRALALAPTYIPVLINRGNILFLLGRDGEALGCFERVTALDPNMAVAWFGRGKILARLRRLDEAVECWQRAAALDQRSGDVLVLLGNLLRELGRYDAALASYDDALKQQPRDVRLAISRAQVLGLLGRFPEALGSCDQALGEEPENVRALITRGDALTALHRPVEALVSYDQALAIEPDNALALNNRSNAFQWLNRYDEALADLSRALTLKPDYADAHLNEALVRFCLGDLAAAWPKYEWRWKCPYWPEKRRDFRQPLWLGQEPLVGKTILLHAEQGLGDTLHFIRYAPLVAIQGAKVFLEVQLALKALVSGMEDIEEVLVRGDELPATDFQCPLLSLPLALRTDLDSVPQKIPYLRPKPELVDRWSARLPSHRGIRVGLAWSGNPRNSNDLVRSLALEHLLPVIELPFLEFVSLQKEVRDRDRALLNSLARCSTSARRSRISRTPRPWSPNSISSSRSTPR
jgi:tetratricopeptide (TPR) repeat protein